MRQVRLSTVLVTRLTRHGGHWRTTQANSTRPAAQGQQHEAKQRVVQQQNNNNQPYIRWA
jgi:hypothetical protein